MSDHSSVSIFDEMLKPPRQVDTESATAAPNALAKDVDKVVVSTGAGAPLSTEYGFVQSEGAREALVDKVESNFINSLAYGLKYEQNATSQLRENSQIEKGLNAYRPQVREFAGAIIDLKLDKESFKSAMETAHQMHLIAEVSNASTRLGGMLQMATEYTAALSDKDSPIAKAIVAMNYHEALSNSGLLQMVSVSPATDPSGLVRQSFQDIHQANERFDFLAKSIIEMGTASLANEKSPMEQYASFKKLAAKLEADFPADKEMAEKVIVLATLVRDQAAGSVKEQAYEDVVKSFAEPLNRESLRVTELLAGPKVGSALDYLQERGRSAYEAYEQYVFKSDQGDVLKTLVGLSKIAQASEHIEMKKLVGPLEAMSHQHVSASELQGFNITPKDVQAAKAELQAAAREEGADHSKITNQSALAALVSREKHLEANPEKSAAFDKDVNNPYRDIVVSPVVDAAKAVQLDTQKDAAPRHEPAPAVPKVANEEHHMERQREKTYTLR